MLGLASKQKKKVNSRQDTIEKVVLTLISSIIAKSSMEIGKELLDVISASINVVISSIKASSDIFLALDSALEIFTPNSRFKSLSASRQAVTDNLPQDTKANLDKRLQNNYIGCMKELEGFQGKSKEIILAIDTTPEESRSKYLNDQYSYVHIGQNNTWKRGFVYSSVYDSTNQLFISAIHRNYHMPMGHNNEVQAFISQLQDSCRIVEEAKSKVKIIDGDRAYYNGELFAAAYFNKISAKCKANDNVRVVVPKKFTREKERKKIEFLENPNSIKVFEDYINLSKYTHPSLIKHCKAARMHNYEGQYHIPIVTVAVVDGYQSNKNRTLKELRLEWMKTKKNIVNSMRRLDAYQNEYLDFQKQAGIRKPLKIKRITQRKRKYFRNSELFCKYKQIIKTMAYLRKMKKYQTEMLNSLMFFCISTRENERIKGKMGYFIKLAQAYHERWGIENGFKEDKAKFIRSSRSRKSTQRQLNIASGMILYNRWHVARMNLMLEKEREKVWNKVAWDPMRPYLRRKLERKYGGLLSAESYLLQVLEYGIKIRLEKILIG